MHLSFLMLVMIVRDEFLQLGFRDAQRFPPINVVEKKVLKYKRI